MATLNSGAKMPPPRIDTTELKHHIGMKLGQRKSEKYFDILNKYLSLRLSKSEFDKLCLVIMGRDNIPLHNGLIRAIMKNACLANVHPIRDPKPKSSLDMKLTNGYRNNLHLLKNVFPRSPRKGRSPSLRGRKPKARLSPLGPNGKTHIVPHEDSGPIIQEQQCATEILSLGSRPPVEVTSEEGEEVEQIALSPGLDSRTPIEPPTGVCFNPKETTREVSSRGSSPLIDSDTCYIKTELPDTCFLRKRLERKLAAEGLNVSTYCVNLLNNGLDAYLKRLLKPCLDLAGSRSVGKSHVSITDFEVAVQSNRRILGQDRGVLIENIGLRTSDEFMDG